MGFFGEQFDGCILRRSWYALPNLATALAVLGERELLGLRVALDGTPNYAAEKCDALAGPGKDACVSNAKVQYGKS